MFIWDGFSQSLPVISGIKKLSVIQTEFFDFIYPPESAQTAELLAKNADSMYLEIASFLNSTSTLRFPVVITQDFQQLNGYFTTIPYNKIVLYDASPFFALSVFSHTIRSVFYHELTHALSLNIKSPFWKGFSRIFGDTYSPLFLNFPTSFVEGIAVSFESIHGEGRLNDSPSLHVIRQAKIEHKFPKWSMITGASTSYTDGSLPYIFGGYFNQYIQHRFGMHKFADFWHEGGKLHFLGFSPYIFKKIYGLSLSRAWTDFEQSITIPPLLDNSHIQTILNAKNRLYHSLITYNQGLAWIEKSSGRVEYIDCTNNPKTNTLQTGKRIKTLFVTELTDKLFTSQKNNLLGVSGFSHTRDRKNMTKIYNNNKNIITLANIHDATFIESDTLLLAGIKSEGSQNHIIIYNFELLKKRKQKEAIITTIAFDNDVLPSNLINIGEHRLAFLIQQPASLNENTHIRRGIAIFNIKTNILETYFPKNHDTTGRFFNLSTDTKNILFAYSANANAIPRLARIMLAENLPELRADIESTAFSGGVFSPVQKNENVIFISRYYEHRNISAKIPAFTENLVLKKTTTPIGYIKQNNIQHTQNKTVAEHNSITHKKYNPLHYMKKGIIIPLIGSIPLHNTDSTNPQDFVFGMSALTIDPAERVLIGGGLGMDLKKNLNANIFLLFYHKAFSFNGNTKIIYKPRAFHIISGSYSINTFIKIPLPFSSIQLSHTLNFTYFDLTKRYGLTHWTLKNQSSALYRFTKKTGYSYYDTFEFTLGELMILNNKKNEKKFPNPQFFTTTKLMLPFLLPFQNPYRLAINLPTVLEFQIENHKNPRMLFTSNTVLFSYIIEDAPQFIPLYFKRFTWDIGTEVFFRGTKFLKLNMNSSVFFTFAANTGVLVNYPFDLGIIFKWTPLENTKLPYTIHLKFKLNL